MQLKERLPIQKYRNFLPSMVSLSKSSMALLGALTSFSTELAAMRFFLEVFPFIETPNPSKFVPRIYNLDQLDQLFECERSLPKKREK